MSPMLAKALEAGIVVLFIGVLTTGLYAGAVPDYRSAIGQDIGDRTLVAVGNEIEQSVPPDAAAVHVESRLDLPTTIRSASYRIVAHGETDAGDDGDSADASSTDSNTTPVMRTGDWTPTTTGTAHDTPRLVLEHPHGAIDGSYTLALPSHVTVVRGSVSGGHGRIIISHSTNHDGLVVTLEDRA